MNTDTIRGGLAGKILRVDLTRNRVWTEDTAPYARRFIGGRAVNSYLLLKETPPGTKWSDPENPLIFGAGCLVGTLAPGACRVSIDTINAFTGGKGSANFGGHFGPELKFAGFDHVVVTGKSDRPVYLFIHDGSAEIRDASNIWGRTTYETETILRRDLADDRIAVAAIGPAGENLVRGSGVVGDLAKVAGGSGVGCVMGSKKLKALVARGRGSIGVADPARFMTAVDAALAKIKASPTTPGFRKGNVEAYCLPDAPLWDIGAECIRNGQVGFWPLDKRVNLVGAAAGVPSFRKNVVACFGCPIGCNPHYIIEKGPYAGLRGTGYRVNSVFYTSRFDVDDPAASIAYHLLTNQLGLDGDTCTVVLAWAFECWQRGLITKEDTGGLELEWGNAEAMIQLLKDLAYRRGFGDFLADGALAAASKLGNGSEAFAIQVKGQDTVDAFRIQKGWGLGISTSPCGPRHLRGAVGAVRHSGPKDLPRETTEYKSQPEAVFWQCQAKEIEDMTGICNYTGTYSGARALGPEDYAELTSAALGIDITAEEFMLQGQVGYNLEKAFNTLHPGFTREDDMPPRRYVEEPIGEGPFKGYKCDRDQWEAMLDRFYELNGWDMNTGRQTRAGLSSLGLDDVAELLARAGRLEG